MEPRYVWTPEVSGTGTLTYDFATDPLVILHPTSEFTIVGVLARIGFLASSNDAFVSFSNIKKSDGTVGNISFPREQTSPASTASVLGVVIRPTDGLRFKFQGSLPSVATFGVTLSPNTFFSIAFHQS